MPSRARGDEWTAQTGRTGSTRCAPYVDVLARLSLPRMIAPFLVSICFVGLVVTLAFFALGLEHPVRWSVGAGAA